MLTITKALNVNGTSKIGTEVVATTYANITDNGNYNNNVNIVNKTLYDANKATVRADIAEFNTKVYAIQDGTTETE